MFRLELMSPLLRSSLRYGKRLHLVIVKPEALKDVFQVVAVHVQKNTDCRVGILEPAVSDEDAPCVNWFLKRPLVKANGWGNRETPHQIIFREIESPFRIALSARIVIAANHERWQRWLTYTLRCGRSIG